MVNIRKCLSLMVLGATLALSACLPDSTDPVKNNPNAAGRVTGEYYANSLANVAVQVQQAIITSPTWFTATTGGVLNLASMGINTDTMGAPMRTMICPTGSGSQVRQISWIDGRDTAGRFNVRGMGTDSATIVGFLRDRTSGDLIGTYRNGGIAMLKDGATATPTALPASCSGSAIPVGAPVIVFTIDRPAAPTTEMARIEYRTVPCTNNKRGTMVQQRKVTYRPDGTWDPANPNAGWGGESGSESVGACVDDIVIATSGYDLQEGAGTANLNNFAATSLRRILNEQLQMDCTKVDVKKSKNAEEARKKNIDTCSLNARSTGQEGTKDRNEDNQTDTRRLECAGADITMRIRFKNLLDDKLGRSTITWYDGHATLVRVVDNSSVTNDTGTDGVGKRKVWIGETINCSGDETHRVACGKVPNAPDEKPQKSTEKWSRNLVDGWFVDEDWFAHVFNLCLFSDCVSVVGGYWDYLNFDYFTGTEQVQNSHVTTWRGMEAITWDDKFTFKPLPTPTTPWKITENICTWYTRTLWVNCPFNYDSTRQGDWKPETITAGKWGASDKYMVATKYAGLPVALNPGIPWDGTTTGKVYYQTVDRDKYPHDKWEQRFYTSEAGLLWKSCNIKGCDKWWEFRGPGKDAFIKSWTNQPAVPANSILISAAAQQIRSDVCGDIQFQLDASNDKIKKAKKYNDKKEVSDQKKQLMDAYKPTLDAAKQAVTNAQSAVSAAQSAYNSASSNYSYYQSLANSAAYSASAAYSSYAAVAADSNSTSAQINAAWSAYASAASYANSMQSTANSYYNQMVARGNELTARQNELNAARTTRDNAQAVYDQKKGVYETAKAETDKAEEDLDKAKKKAEIGMGRDLTDAERAEVQKLNDALCTSSGNSLNFSEQKSFEKICTQHYNNPGMFNYLPGVNELCKTMFKKETKDGNVTLEFKKVDSGKEGTVVQTTILNRNGVLLAHRPQIEDNTKLIVRQNGFWKDLYCGRNEETAIAWPLQVFYVSCGGKGGCRTLSYMTTTTITEAITREWKGKSYTEGTWSYPTRVYHSALYGSWATRGEIPNPIVTWANAAPVVREIVVDYGRD